MRLHSSKIYQIYASISMLFTWILLNFQVYLQQSGIHTWTTRSHNVSELLVAKYPVYSNMVSISTALYAVVMVFGWWYAILYLGHHHTDICTAVRFSASTKLHAKFIFNQCANSEANDIVFSKLVMSNMLALFEYFVIADMEKQLLP